MSSAECCVHLVGVNRLSACRKFFWVHSWQNGTRCRDGVNVLCRSHLVWLVFEGSIPTCACFPLEHSAAVNACKNSYILLITSYNDVYQEESPPINCDSCCIINIEWSRVKQAWRIASGLICVHSV